MDDFETVRYGLLDSEAEDELRPDVSAAHAALGRIEAENERLRAENEGLKYAASLQQSEDEMSRRLIAEGQAENERLRAQEEILREIGKGWEAELERLRAAMEAAANEARQLFMFEFEAKLRGALRESR